MPESEPARLRPSQESHNRFRPGASDRGAPVSNNNSVAATRSRQTPSIFFPPLSTSSGSPESFKIFQRATKTVHKLHPSWPRKLALRKLPVTQTLRPRLIIYTGSMSTTLSSSPWSTSCKMSSQQWVYVIHQPKKAPRNRQLSG